MRKKLKKIQENAGEAGTYYMYPFPERKGEYKWEN